MSLLKHFFYSTFLVTTTLTALAGGEEPHQPAEVLVPPDLPNTGIYLEADLGYVSRNWGHVFNFQNVDVTNRTGGFSGGVAAGYEFSHLWSAEFGWMHLPTASVKRADSVLDELSSWFIYTAAKISVPVHQMANIYAKLGVSYTNNKNVASAGSVVSALQSEYWSGYFAMGAQYFINQNLSLNAQFAYLPGLQVAVTSATKFPTPNACLFTLGIGYKFIL